jgi:hypothetical protein
VPIRPNDHGMWRPLALVSSMALDDPVRMDHDLRFVMVDPATDQVLAECAGPDASGRCRLADTPPYACAGLRLINLEDEAEQASFIVGTMEAGRCPAAHISRRADAGRRDDEPKTIVLVSATPRLTALNQEMPDD